MQGTYTGKISLTDRQEPTSSRFAVNVAGASGTLHGKAAVRPYWRAGLAATPDLHFTLEVALLGPDSIAILYRNQAGRRVAEVVVLDEERRVIRGMAHYA